MSNKNEVFEYLIDQLRQQVDSNPYKQQCEDLAHEVQSLKNQLRDALALVDELQETIKLMNEDFDRVTNHGGLLPKGKSYVVGEHGPEQSGCRKDDTQECHHNWRFVNGKTPAVCINCGVTKSSECEHEWQFYGVGFPCMCIKCGLKK